MDLVEILKALADENRIRILNILKEGELCVGEIEYVLGITQSNVSKHLNKLYSLKLITYMKKAQWVYYQLNNKLLNEYPFIIELLEKELLKVEPWNEDITRLKDYRSSNLTCENLKGCTCNKD